MFGLVLLVLLVLSLGSSKACVHYLTLAVISPNALLSCKSVETARYRFKGIFNQVAFEKKKKLAILLRCSYFKGRGEGEEGIDSDSFEHVCFSANVSLFCQIYIFFLATATLVNLDPLSRGGGRGGGVGVGGDGV